MAKNKRKQSAGLGDTVEKIIRATGVHKLVPDDCGCEERKEALNKLLSYKMKVVNCPDEEMIEKYLNFVKVRTLTISNEHRKMVCEYYAKVFNRPYYEPCVNCSAKPYIKMIDELDKIFIL